MGINGIGFTGTRQGMTLHQLESLSTLLVHYRLKYDQFHHGLCIGADAQAHDIAARQGYWIVGHPPINESHVVFKNCAEMCPPAEYMVRNTHIVRAAEILIGAPAGFKEEIRSGTWSCLRFAEKTGVRMLIITPDGAVHDKTDLNGFRDIIR